MNDYLIVILAILVGDYLLNLIVDTLSNLTPHPLKVFLSYSHPPVLDRIDGIQKRQPGASVSS